MMLAAGHPRALLVTNVVSSACFSVTVLVCASWGLIAACIGVAVYRVLGLAATQYVLATRKLGIPLHHTLILDPGPAAASLVALLAVAVPVAELTSSAAPLVSVAVTSVAGLGAYAIALRLLFHGAWSDVRMTVQSVLPRRATKFVSASAP